MPLKTPRNVKILLTVCFILFPPAADAEELVVAPYSYGVSFSSYSINISPIIRSAVDRLVPDFKIWSRKAFPAEDPELNRYNLTKKQCPQAVFGDFNGDGNGDVALWGHDRKNALLIAVLSYQKKDGAWDYRAETIIRESSGAYFAKGPCESYKNTGNVKHYLTFVPKGLVKSDCGPGPINLVGDAFEFNDLCGGSGWFYYYENGKFKNHPILCE